MGDLVARGLPADWLNGWLAAVGVTVLVPGTRLAWTDDPVPRACFSWPSDEELPELIARHLPATEELDELVIAGLPQNMKVDQYQEAAGRERQRREPGLGILATDLDLGTRAPDAPLATGPFNVGAPRGETLFTRLRACRRALDGEPVDRQVAATLAGRGRRHDTNGLGFDYRRISASVAKEARKLVDPVVECLCFYGLQLHPMGGNGTSVWQRGWIDRPDRRRAFVWPVWTRPHLLDRWAVDALLDIVYRDSRRQAQDGRFRVIPSLRRLGVSGLYGSIPFERTGSSDATRGYASERVA